MDPNLDWEGDTIMTDAPPLSPPSTPPADPWNRGFNFGTVVRNPRFNPLSVASWLSYEDSSQPDFVQPRPRAPRKLGRTVDKNHSGAGATADTAQQSGSRRPQGMETVESGESRQADVRSIVDQPGQSLQSDQKKHLDNLDEQMTAKQLSKKRKRFLQLKGLL